MGGQQGVALLTREAHHLLHRGAQGSQGIRSGAQVQHPPGALLPQAWDHAGVHEGALARAGRSNHGKHRLPTQALHEAVQLLVAAMEQGRVLLVKGQQAREGVQIHRAGGLPPGEDPAQGSGHFGGGGPSRGILVHARGHQLAQLPGNLLSGFKPGRGVGGDHLGGQLEHRRGIVGPVAAQHFEQDNAHGPDIGGGGTLGAAPLLRRHVGGRALGTTPLLLELHRVHLGRLLATQVHGGGELLQGGHLGQAEIHHPQAPVRGDDHVLRLQVAVQHIVEVRLLQGLGHGQHHPQGGLDPQPSAGHARTQVLAVQILQGQIGVVMVQPHGVDGYDVRVGEAGRGAGLEQEPLDLFIGARDAGPHHLEGHLAPQPGVPGQVHIPHAAPAHKANHPEVVHHVLGAEEGRPLRSLTHRHHTIIPSIVSIRCHRYHNLALLSTRGYCQGQPVQQQ